MNCYITFCSECGADEEIIRYHGSKYHRPKCNKGKDIKEGLSVCPLCETKKCQMPNDLDDGELSKAEIPYQLFN